eukprot:TRINITY_DN780092_c0_g1_i1.p1 TRINITY_DN780092_c0_g1~~TRINITY_DN780092_c0_g1_i1.p1  ORF type:complete len:289 (-),score=68.02 TRINITY_DN780092_c0_g1_i1:160-1026(-)
MSIASIKLLRSDGAYFEGDIVEGIIQIDTPSEIKHNGVVLKVTGSVSYGSGKGLLETLSSKSIPLLSLEKLLAGKSGIPKGHTEIPFEFKIEPTSQKKLHETYHGVSVRVVYRITTEVIRSKFSKNLVCAKELNVGVPSEEIPKSEVIEFEVGSADVEPEGLEYIPNFLLKGKLHRSHCFVNAPVTGEIVIQNSESALSDVMLKLVRIEKIEIGTNIHCEESTIQTNEVIHGDVCQDLVVPMHMVLPRLTTCPTTCSSAFSVEFEAEVCVRFVDGIQVSKRFPITLLR